jgi:hypothetical protein
MFKHDAYPWRGIEFGLELIKEGLIWRVGNGNSINIWRDNWVPRDYNSKISQGETSARIRRVDQLLLQDCNNWNEALVRKISVLEDAEWILNLKLPVRPCDDILGWNYDNFGELLVKSAYILAYNLKNGTRWHAGASSKQDNSRDIWKSSWNVKVPSKVKVFGWRVACDNLATKKNNFRRTLEFDSTCSLCGTEEQPTSM